MKTSDTTTKISHSEFLQIQSKTAGDKQNPVFTAGYYKGRHDAYIHVLRILFPDKEGAWSDLDGTPSALIKLIRRHLDYREGEITRLRRDLSNLWQACNQFARLHDTHD